MTATAETFKAAWIANLKSKPSVITPVPVNEVKETEYQSTNWTYPCIRVAVEFLPSSNYCGPDDANIEIEVYSEEKSSKQAVHIASMIQEEYHGHPFSQGTTKFNTVVVKKVAMPDRTVPAWMVKVQIFCQGVTT